MTRTADRSLRIETLSSTGATRDMLDRALARLAAWGVGADGCGKVRIVLAEVLNNVVEHAYALHDGEPVALELTLADGRLTCQVTDQGRAFPGNALPPGELPAVDLPLESLPEGGFGWHLIYELTDRLDYLRDEDRNVLTLHFDLA